MIVAPERGKAVHSDSLPSGKASTPKASIVIVIVVPAKPDAREGLSYDGAPARPDAREGLSYGSAPARPDARTPAPHCRCRRGARLRQCARAETAEIVDE